MNYQRGKNQRPCECPSCFLLVCVAMDLAVAGDLEAAEIVAQSVTWIDVIESDGYYTTTWAPIVVEDRTDERTDRMVTNAEIN